ncbi:MAG TPA: hypothetical protein VL357_05875 [Rariglobus sp.]|jgi:hypothetical protein|nr:hypothetical protein [Rariglobus sp.]
MDLFDHQVLVAIERVRPDGKRHTVTMVINDGHELEPNHFAHVTELVRREFEEYPARGTAHEIQL